MYSLSALKRSHQIGLIVISLLLLCTLVFGIIWYLNHVVAPARFIEQVRQTQEVSAEEINIESITADLTLTIAEQLKAQLEASNISQPDQAAKVMLPDAAAFLTEQSKLVDMLNIYLKKLAIEESAWLKQDSTFTEQYYQINDTCLVIKRLDGEWLLHRLNTCSANFDAIN